MKLPAVLPFFVCMIQLRSEARSNPQKLMRMRIALIDIL